MLLLMSHGGQAVICSKDYLISATFDRAVAKETFEFAAAAAPRCSALTPVRWKDSIARNTTRFWI